MDKVINEFRVIETDDGYRIEIKGDKEKMKSFMHGFGQKGWNRHAWRKWRSHHDRFGFGFGPMMWSMASCCGPWDFDVAEEDTEEETQGA